MQQLMHSFAGHTAPPDILAAVRRGDIASFCLFKGLNVETPAQLRALNEDLRRAAREAGQPPLLIGIDQEGGQLIAVTGGATELPGNMALGATRSAELSEQAGRVLGRELRAMGVNLNFAPSLDVNINPANPGIGVRSFGADPALVAELGIAMMRGLHAEGVIAAVKHFPGHGDVVTDPHHASAAVTHPLDRIEQVELAPFRAAIQAGAKAVMSAHILFTALDPKFPATISPAILEGCLRGQMGFDGVILTDAMDMHAVAQYGREESVRMALQAGADLVLLGHVRDQLALIPLMRSLARPASLRRIQTLREADPDSWPPFEMVGCAEHQQIAQAIADRAITLVRGGERLPLRPGPEDTIAVITPEPVNLTPADTSASAPITLAERVRARHARTLAFELPNKASVSDISAALQAVQGAEIVIVGTTVAERDEAQASLVRALVARGQRPIVVSLRTPYDLMAFPMVETYLCAYGTRPVAMEAAARVLFGEIEARGVLPCPIPGIPEAQGV